MVDVHSHILAGVDDGCENMDETLRMAEMYLEQGVKEVVATPHVGAFIKEDASKIVQAFEETKEALWKRGMPLEIHLGGEVRCARSRTLSDEERRRYSLGWSNWILLEIGDPFSGARAAKKSAALLQEKGHSVLLAHPERSLRSIKEASELYETGIAFQVTSLSLVGNYGKKAESLGREMIASGMVSVVASDGHRPEHRPPLLAPAMKEAGLEHLTSLLCDEMPRWMLYGGEKPISSESQMA